MSHLRFMGCTDTLRGSFPPARCAVRPEPRRHEAALGTLYTGERSSTEGKQRRDRDRDRGQASFCSTFEVT
ncbi:hypothetical protein NQZ68_033033 [Dissostichus eleginoides]|nr:hypothetical protein NQZ68_033033 [Dissostichus eleginoides]